MKKLFVFVLIVLLLCCAKLTAVENLYLGEIFPSADVEVYMPEQADVEGVGCLNNGVGQIAFVAANNLQYILNNYKTSGYTLKIYGKTMAEVLQTLSPNNFYQKNDMVYGYKNGIGYNAINDEINFQCTQKQDCVLLGVPILLGSY